MESLEEGLARADRRVAQASKRMQAYGDVAGQYVSRGLRAMTAAMSAVGAAQAAQEKSWLSLAAIIASNYAAGGPVMASIAAMGAAVGLLAGKQDEAAKKWEEDMKRISAATEKAASEIRSMDEAFFVSRGGTKGLFRLDETLRELEAAQERVDKLAASGAKAPSPFDRWLGEMFERLPGIEAGPALQLARGSESLKNQEVLRDRLVELVSREARGMAEQVQNETRLLGITDERLRKVQEIVDERDRLVATFQEMQAKGVAVPEGFASWDTVIAAVNERAMRLIEQMPQKLGKVSQAWQTVGDTAFAVLDGIIVRGGKTDDVIRGVIQSLASMGLRAGIDAAASGLSRP